MSLVPMGLEGKGMHLSVRWEATIRIEHLVCADDGIGIGDARQNRTGHVLQSGSD
jgi:hypothetical protein